MTTLDSLLERWTTDAERFRAFGQEATAATIERCRAELSEWWREYQLETLSLHDAATYSHLTYEAIRKRVERGTIPNANPNGRPRVRRCDLPAKPPGLPDDDGTISIAERRLGRSR